MTKLVLGYVTRHQVSGYQFEPQMELALHERDTSQWMKITIGAYGLCAQDIRAMSSSLISALPGSKAFRGVAALLDSLEDSIPEKDKDQKQSFVCVNQPPVILCGRAPFYGLVRYSPQVIGEDAKASVPKVSESASGSSNWKGVAAASLRAAAMGAASSVVAEAAIQWWKQPRCDEIEACVPPAVAVTLPADHAVQVLPPFTLNPKEEGVRASRLQEYRPDHPCSCDCLGVSPAPPPAKAVPEPHAAPAIKIRPVAAAVEPMKSAPPSLGKPVEVKRPPVEQVVADEPDFSAAADFLRGKFSRESLEALSHWLSLIPKSAAKPRANNPAVPTSL